MRNLSTYVLLIVFFLILGFVTINPCEWRQNPCSPRDYCSYALHGGSCTDCVPCRYKRAQLLSVDQLIIALKEERNFPTAGSEGSGGCYCRADVAKELGQRGDVRAIQPLIDALNSSDDDWTSPRARFLGLWGSRTSKHMLTKGHTYYAAIESLARFNSAARAAGPRILELMNNEKDENKKTMMRAALKAIDPFLIQ
jgi:hypothetical protein